MQTPFLCCQKGSPPCAGVKLTEMLGRMVSVNVCLFASDVFKLFWLPVVLLNGQNAHFLLFTVCKCSQLRQTAVGTVIFLPVFRNFYLFQINKLSLYSSVDIQIWNCGMRMKVLTFMDKLSKIISPLASQFSIVLQCYLDVQ